MKIKITYIGWWGSMKVRGLNLRPYPAPPPLSPDLDMSHTTPRTTLPHFQALMALPAPPPPAALHVLNRCPHALDQSLPTRAQPGTARARLTSPRPHAPDWLPPKPSVNVHHRSGQKICYFAHPLDELHIMRFLNVGITPSKLEDCYFAHSLDELHIMC
jgi:hypothetical protein